MEYNYKICKTPATELFYKVQKDYGEAIKKRVVSVKPAGRNTLVTIEVTLPDGDTYTASAGSKKEATQRVSQKVLKIIKREEIFDNMSDEDIVKLSKRKK